MNREMIKEKIEKHPGQHYIYLLKDPQGHPFYIGLGQGARIFQHEEDARNPMNKSKKAERIRKIVN